MKVASTLPPYPGGISTDEAVKDIDSTIEISSKLGFEYVEMSDTPHVSNEWFNFQNIPTLGRASTSFDHLAGFFILPLYDPVHLAEGISTLASFVDKFDFWCAVGGPARQADYEAFGIGMSDRAARFEEQITLLQRLWETNHVTHRGDFFDVDDVTITSSTGPSRLCIGGSARRAVERAGNMGDAWIIAPSEDKLELETKIGWFENAGGGDMIIRRNCVVLDDAAEAQAFVRDEIGEVHAGLPVDDRHVIIGNVSDAVKELRYLEDLGIDEVVVRPIGDRHSTETLSNISEAADRL